MAREATLPYLFSQFEAEGHLANFRRAANLEEGGHQGYRFHDSDVYKGLEAVAYSQANHFSTELEQCVRPIIESIVKAQEDDGYIFSYLQLGQASDRWKNLSNMHEMYCGGHLIEAAVAWSEFADDRSLLNVALKYAELLDHEFGANGRPGFCGHAEIEIALVRLGEHLGDDRWIQLAYLMLDRRGHRPSIYEVECNDPALRNLCAAAMPLLEKDGKYDGRYAQDHLPLEQQPKAEGHSVRALYLFTAAQAILRHRPNAPWNEALESIWENLIAHRMYVTGGVGSSGDNEGFTEDDDFPEEDAYAETCAACALAMWARERVKNNVDKVQSQAIMELALYNGALAGLSLDGKQFFYANPIASSGQHQRQDWFKCACCPPNIARVIAGIDRFIDLDQPASESLSIQTSRDGRKAVHLGPFVMAWESDNLADLPPAIADSSEWRVEWKDLGPKVWLDHNQVLIPYFSWGNKGPSQMKIWLNAAY